MEKSLEMRVWLKVNFNVLHEIESGRQHQLIEIILNSLLAVDDSCVN